MIAPGPFSYPFEQPFGGEWDLTPSLKGVLHISDEKQTAYSTGMQQQCRLDLQIFGYNELLYTRVGFLQNSIVPSVRCRYSH